MFILSSEEGREDALVLQPMFWVQFATGPYRPDILVFPSMVEKAGDSVDSAG